MFAANTLASTRRSRPAPIAENTYAKSAAWLKQTKRAYRFAWTAERIVLWNQKHRRGTTPNNFLKGNPVKDKQINTVEDLWAVLGRIDCSVGAFDFKWRFKTREFGSNDGPPPIGFALNPVAGWLLCIEFWRLDVNTREMGWGRGRDEVVMLGAWESGVVKTAFVLHKLLLEHEMMEGFTYRGVRIFDPHRTVHELSLLDPNRNK